MKIACFHLNQIGDLLFSLPALKSLKEWDPDGTLISVARPSGKVLLERTGLPDEVLVRESGLGRSKVRLLNGMRTERLDAAVLFSQSAECITLAYVSGAPQRYGITTRWLDWMLTKRVSCSRPPSTANDLRVLQLMDCPPACTSYVGLISPNAEDRESAEALLADFGIDGKPLLVIAPGTSSRRSVKAWVTQRWIDVIDHFGSTGGMAVVTVGLDDFTDVLSRTSVPVIDLCGKTSLTVLLAVLEKAKVLIGVDSGVLHLAAAVGARVVGLYGMSDPKTTGPQGEGHVIVRAGLECSPCQLSACDIGGKCMTSIESSEVIAAAESVLRSSEKGDS